MVAQLLSMNCISSLVENQSIIVNSSFATVDDLPSGGVVEPARVGLSLAEQGWRSFAPGFEGDSSARARLAKLAALPEDARLQALAQELSKLVPISIPQHHYQAAVLILRDLTQMGWLVCVDRGQIYIRPHEAREPGGQPPKEAIRRQHDFARKDQLKEEATRRFIHTLERPSRFSSCKPVTHLIADGRRLAEHLLPIARMPREARAEALRTICQPYLQLATEERDEHTNIRLIDIWRYFRHSWISRYRSMPGRNLFYLIRDAAQPNHPVMAITALGNAVMQLTARDAWLGWTLNGLQALRAEGLFTDEEILKALRERLRRDLDDIYLDDLGMDKFGEDDTPALLAHLRFVEEESRAEREATLKAREGRRQSGDDDGDDEADVKAFKVSDISKIDLVAAAKRPLFRSKRARVARELVQALDALKYAPGTLSEVLADPKAEWAIGQALRQLKKVHSATSMMEIIICGAAPPYNHLLGGKLACLMMLSPRVVADYYERYKEESSIIASQMAGRPIVKTPHLVLLGTTSLYAERSSQYSRVVLPKGTLRGQLADLRYIERGLTGGFGQPNLSRETEAAMARLATKQRDYRNVNFEYGEGQSPKLRQLREGFSALGLDASSLLNHGSNRIVYVAPLVDNTRRYLLGIESVPRGASDPVDGDARVAEFWRSRWLASRLDHEPALAAIAASTPLSLRVSQHIPEVQSSPQLGLFSCPGSDKESTMAMATPPTDERLEFIRMLYRDESAYSDHVNISRLRELNIRTPLERTLRAIIDASASVVITGNAGDGKTHTIRLLEADLKKRGADVIQDASEERPEEIIERWAAARTAGRPFCIAINEGPLVDLIRAYKDQHPWLIEIRDQLFGLVRYERIADSKDEPEHWEPHAGETVVVDLSLRQTLSKGLTRSIIKKLTEDRWYEGCASCPGRSNCAVTYNRAVLQRDAVLDRVTALLERVAERGVRVTFRESLAFCSYLIFGGRSCQELCELGASEDGRYYWTAFDKGEGVLFEQLAAGLDPLTQTAAKLDDDLWGGRFNPSEFSGADLAAPTPLDLDGLDPLKSKPTPDDCFAALKRRWYFEHPKGSLQAATEAEALLQELRNTNLSSQLRVGRLLKYINAWWNPESNDAEQEFLRIWTGLSYSPRGNPMRQTRISGRVVEAMELTLLRPVLAPALHDSFGEQPEDHLLLAPLRQTGAASLRVDSKLLMALMLGARAERDPEAERRLLRFNDAMARYATLGTDVRRVLIIDPQKQSRVHVRVDLKQRRYDSIG